MSSSVHVEQQSGHPAQVGSTAPAQQQPLQGGQAGQNASAHRVKVIHNSRYVPNGTKSLGNMIRKYSIMPTLETAFVVLDEIFSAEAHGLMKRLGVKHRSGHKFMVQRRMMKADPATNTAGEVQAEDVQNDSEYLCPVTIGTPAQTFHLDFDTGSADLWVRSTELPKKVQADGVASAHAFFDPVKSSTFRKSPGEAWNITYGDGSSASGDVGTDVLHVGGVTVHDQAIELASKMSHTFQKDSADGLMGLAFGSINTVQPQQVRTPVENMVLQKDISPSAELFTAYLTSHQHPNETSFYTFGVIDEDACEGRPVHYAPVDNSNGFWQFASDYCSVNGERFSRRGNTAIADTGTTLAMVDDQTCRHVYSQIHGATYSSQLGGYIFPSNTPVSALPIVKLDIGGHMFALNPAYLAFADAGDGMTYGCMQSRGDMSFDILGDAFLKSIYAIFDVGNLRFGAVQRKYPGMGAHPNQKDTTAPTQQQHTTQQDPAQSHPAAANPTGSASSTAQPDTHAPTSAPAPAPPTVTPAQPPTSAAPAAVPAPPAAAPSQAPVAPPSAPNPAAPAPVPGTGSAQVMTAAVPVTPAPVPAGSPASSAANVVNVPGPDPKKPAGP